MRIMDMERSKVIAEFDRFNLWWGEDMALTIEGTEYKMYRGKKTQGAYILETAGTVLARAKYATTSFFTGPYTSFTIEFADNQFTLLQESMLSEQLTLLEGPTEIGSFALYGACSPDTAAMNFPEGLPIPVRAIVIGLAVVCYMPCQG